MSSQIIIPTAFLTVASASEYLHRRLIVRMVTTFSERRTIRTLMPRYLAVGTLNTAFGYGCFVLFTMLLSPLMPYGYVLASLLANLVAITFAFLGYKWFVFRTDGGYLKEWIRCLGVYTGSGLLSAAALPLLVPVIRRVVENQSSAPYIAGAIVLVFSVLFSFFGHRHISFYNSKQSTPSPR